MDAIDKKILQILQTEGQISNQDLADRVSLSPSPCSRRVKNLEAEGYIRKYVALLEPRKLNLNLTIVVSVSLGTHASEVMQSFEDKVAILPEVTQCDLIAGQSADYLLKVMVASLDEYHAFLLNTLMRLEGVKNVQSSFVLKSIVDRSELPLTHA